MMTDIVADLRDAEACWDTDAWRLCGKAADEIERLRNYVRLLACDCEPGQCKVYGEDWHRFDCGYRKAAEVLGEGKE